MSVAFHKLSTTHGLRHCYVIEGRVGDSFKRCIELNNARDNYNKHHDIVVGKKEYVRDYVMGMHAPHYPVPAIWDQHLVGIGPCLVTAGSGRLAYT